MLQEMLWRAKTMLRYCAKMNRYGILILLIVFGEVAVAQDIHFSQNAATPLVQSPALTGNFDGDYRFGAIYRNQWSSVTVPYVTFSGFADMRTKKELLGNDFVGLGLIAYSDKSGTGALSTQTITGSAAYHKMLGTDNKHLFSFGFQAAYVQKKIDYSLLTFHNQYEGFEYQSTLPTGETLGPESFTYLNLNVGVGWTTHVNEKMDVFGTISAFNLTQPKESFLDADDNKLDMRFKMLSGVSYVLNEKMTLHPFLLVESQTNAFEFDLGTYFVYGLKKSALTNTALVLGGWYRLGDAAVLAVGYDYNNYRFTVSYDSNVSSLRAASNTFGAYELSLVYIFNSKPPLEIKKSIPCKRL